MRTKVHVSSLHERLIRPLSFTWLIVGWIVVSVWFICLVYLFGGPTYDDADVTVFTTWSLAHGHMACAYLPQGVLGYPPTAPVYPILSAAASALFRIGHSLPFPNSIQLGRHCVTATAAITRWSLHSQAVGPTLRIGLAAWVVLGMGAISIFRAAGRGRCGWELIGLFLLACLPPVTMSLAEYFHPQDLVSMGLILMGLACVLGERWIWTGILLGLALSTQQFAILVFVPLLAIVPRPRLPHLILGAIGAAAVIDIPLALLSSGQAIVGELVGTGASSYLNTVLDLFHLHASLLYLVSRGIPIMLALALGWWATERLGSTMLKPIPLASLMATALTLRLVFEVNFWGYYLMAVAVMLAVLDVVRGRIRVTFLLWLTVIAIVSLKGGLVNTPRFSWLPIWIWQVLLVPSALALAVSPLLHLAKRRCNSPTPQASSIRPVAE